MPGQTSLSAPHSIHQTNLRHRQDFEAWPARA